MFYKTVSLATPGVSLVPVLNFVVVIPYRLVYSFIQIVSTKTKLDPIKHIDENTLVNENFLFLDVVLQLENCFASPSQNISDDPKHSLIEHE